jgi:hypothetical protein
MIRHDLFEKGCRIIWHLFYLISCVFSCFYLTSCSVFNPSSQSSTSNRVRVPAVKPVQIPGGNTDNWRYLGTTTTSQIIEEIDDTSIKAIDLQIYGYQDRKTITDVETFDYQISQPHYKYLLSQWLINCQTLQYLLTNVVMYNGQGTILKSYDYTQDNNVRWLKIGSGSIAEMQYKYICQNQNRMLGY